jgi:hypothetical protein
MNAMIGQHDPERHLSTVGLVEADYIPGGLVLITVAGQCRS